MFSFFKIKRRESDEETFICLHLNLVFFLHATDRQGVFCLEYKSQKQMVRTSKNFGQRENPKEKVGQNKHSCPKCEGAHRIYVCNFCGQSNKQQEIALIPNHPFPAPVQSERLLNLFSGHPQSTVLFFCLDLQKVSLYILMGPVSKCRLQTFYQLVSN